LARTRKDSGIILMSVYPPCSRFFCTC
jgi:hypothetical protein